MLNNTQKIIDALDKEIKIFEKICKDETDFQDSRRGSRRYLDGLKKAQEIFLEQYDLPF